MRYSLRTLLFAMFLGGPGLAMLWWLRHTWSVQVLGILVLMLAGLTLIVGILTAVEWLVRKLLYYLSAAFASANFFSTSSR
jgi:hypothetical protein